ncbi:hypothetical protein TSOC_003217 [Tetrabaena socialis]|uniref:Vacuolar ATPase assembly integral membrane protein VMA21 n=1 Tax=Tetrabaena socialis TaxID=47790 RepID=A0A2J8AC59_9CHLO|nr:hypothetical protein TSOC_003217 [Tetrabaena socialis]|eukprot:PNH10087.1 hypothetical protein TSOC_003217 [Tetrabaena socialis]
MSTKISTRPKPAEAVGLPPGAGRALTTVAIFSLLMVTCPFLLYYSSYEGYLDPLYAITVGIPAPEGRAVASAIFAVLGVNLVVGCFIFVAFREVIEPDKPAAKPQPQVKKDN